MIYNVKNIAVINRTTCLTDDKVGGMILSVQKQINQHFAPIWGVSAVLTLMKERDFTRYNKGAWVIYFDDKPKPGEEEAYGYHENSPDGDPVGYVFAGLDLANNLDPCVTFSHEVLEMLADPACNACVLVEQHGRPVLYATEVCDAVEDDSDAYVIGDYRVSNFVTPEYFDPLDKNKQLDFRRLLNRPLEIRRGGYMPVFRIGVDKEWTQFEGEHARRLQIKKATRQGFSRTFKRNERIHKQLENSPIIIPDQENFSRADTLARARFESKYK